MDPRTTIVLQKKAGNKNQRFCMRKINGFLTIINKCSTYTLTGTGEGLAYQYDRGYESQKMTIKYNDDGTVCIVMEMECILIFSMEKLLTMQIWFLHLNQAKARRSSYLNMHGNLVMICLQMSVRKCLTNRYLARV